MDHQTPPPPPQQEMSGQNTAQTGHETMQQQPYYPPPPQSLPQPSQQSVQQPYFPPPPQYQGQAPQHSGPPLPSRVEPPPSASAGIPCPQCEHINVPGVAECGLCHIKLPPPLPGRGHNFGDAPSTAGFAPPPRRHQQTWGDDDPSNPAHYARDPHKLVAYIIPLPEPVLATAPAEQVPHRFLIYTPPPPPLKKPQLAPGEKEDKMHLVQRKWQDEVRKAKTRQEETSSWKKIHHKMVRGTNKAMSMTTSANLDFLGRAGGGNPSPTSSRPSTPERLHGNDGVEVPHEAPKSVAIDEMCFIYPASMGTDEEALRREFIDTLMRTKSKAQKDSVIATGLVPVGFGIDFMLVVVGGLGEIATVWAFKSIMGAKTARSISKRLAAAEANQGAQGQLKLTFKPSPRLEMLKDYLDAECARIDPQMFPRQGQYHIPPTEGQVLDAIGWSPHQSDGETKNWEDEQWEVTEVREDFKITMHKGAKEWKKFCAGLEKDWVKKEKASANNPPPPAPGTTNAPLQDGPQAPNVSS